MKLIIDIDTENEEATDNPRGFVHMTLTKIAGDIREYVSFDKGEITAIRDTKGNEVGHYYFIAEDY